MQIIIKEDALDGAVYVLLNGVAFIKGNNDVDKIKIGSVFGALQLIEDHFNSINKNDVLNASTTDATAVYRIHILKGTLLRLKVADYAKVIDPNYDEKYDDINPNLELIKLDPIEEITNELPEYITFKNMSKELKDQILLYKNVGNIGRKKTIRKGDSTLIYILLNGEIRLNLSKNRKSRIRYKFDKLKKIDHEVTKLLIIVIN
jgi:hypothetical protein